MTKPRFNPWALQPVGVALAMLSCAGGSANLSVPSPDALVAGQARTSVEGCLVKPLDRQEASKSAGHLEPDEVTVRARAGGVLVHHTLTHLCCLGATVDLTFNARHVTLTENLVGEPCRCVCNSTIDSAVALEPGPWTIHVVRKENSQPVEVAQEQVRVSPR